MRRRSRFEKAEFERVAGNGPSPVGWLRWVGPGRVDWGNIESQLAVAVWECAPEKLVALIPTRSYARFVNRYMVGIWGQTTFSNERRLRAIIGPSKWIIERQLFYKVDIYFNYLRGRDILISVNLHLIELPIYRVFLSYQQAVNLKNEQVRASW